VVEDCLEIQAAEYFVHQLELEVAVLSSQYPSFEAVHLIVEVEILVPESVVAAQSVVLALTVLQREAVH
jgi:hypothetical protein